MDITYVNKSRGYSCHGRPSYKQYLGLNCKRKIIIYRVHMGISLIPRSFFFNFCPIDKICHVHYFLFEYMLIQTVSRNIQTFNKRLEFDRLHLRSNCVYNESNDRMSIFLLQSPKRNVQCVIITKTYISNLGKQIDDRFPLIYLPCLILIYFLLAYFIDLTHRNKVVQHKEHIIFHRNRTSTQHDRENCHHLLVCHL